MGTENLEKLAWIAQISRSSGQRSANWVDLVQFAVNFESSISRGLKWKMAGKFRVICQKLRLFGYWGDVHGFLIASRCMNGMDFASFTI